MKQRDTRYRQLLCAKLLVCNEAYRYGTRDA